ncbi:MAG: LPS export ABC transporter ATP-binding protein [Desulfohalobiaceae bacterium]|nr:LPS export ABC transporter ATP-binding protein [Desulfohalobiaceae bacterium]
MSQVTAQDLSKQYGNKVVVDEVGLSLKQGEVVGLLGPNGAGKTTTFYMLVGIIKPNRGRIFVDQVEISDWPLHKRARYGLSYLPQESSVFKKLTVRQNIEIIIEYTGLSRKEKQEKTRSLLRELGIDRLENQKALLLSGGERRRLEIARSLIQDPGFILLDEPFAGIDPLAIVDIQGIVNSLRQKGIGVLISDHNVRETMQICDRVYLVFEGRIILEGTPQEIVRDSRARQCYLGEGFTL